MTETPVTTERADLDIVEDIEHLIAHYPPSRNDQRHIKVQVKNGHVTLSGHVQTPNTRRYLVSQIPGVEGVRSVNANGLYADENIRLEVGKVLPMGVQLARVYYGTVVLSGKLAADVSAEQVAGRVREIPGVESVAMGFH